MVYHHVHHRMRFRSRRSFARRRATRFVQSVMRKTGPIKVHRIWNPSTDRGTVAGAVSTYVLLQADDDPLDNSYSDLGGSNIAECESDSRIKRLDLTFNISGTTGDRGTWMLVRNVDAAITLSTAGLVDQLMQGVETATIQSLRKNCLAMGLYRIPSDRTHTIQRVRVKRKALMRAGLMQDGDALTLVLENKGANSMQLTHAQGRIWTMRN